MAVSGKHTPFMLSVTATTTPQSLYTLAKAVYSNFPDHVCYLAIQLDTAAGGGSLYIGNSNVAANMCGVDLSANQAQQIFASDSNLIIPQDIYLLASTGTAQVNITAVVR